jgi:hypothetical protein
MIGCPFANIEVEPPELDFSMQEGSPTDPTMQKLKINMVSSGQSINSHWTLTSSGNCPIHLISTYGEGPATVWVEVHSVGMAAGYYSGAITLNSRDAPNLQPPNPPLTVAVKLKVTPKPTPPPPPNPPPPQPPPEPPQPVHAKVAITWPIGGETLYYGDTEKITWVTDNDTDETLDILLQVGDNEPTTIATGVSVSTHTYPWLVNEAPCDDAVILLRGPVNTAKCLPFSIRGNICVICKSFMKMRATLKEMLHWSL